MVNYGAVSKSGIQNEQKNTVDEKIARKEASMEKAVKDEEVKVYAPNQPKKEMTVKAYNLAIVTEEALPGSKIIDYVKNGQKVKAIGIKGDYTKISYGNIVGYISSYLLTE